MRLALLFALAACGSRPAPRDQGKALTNHAGKPSPPEPDKFRAMTPDEQCKVTAPRATPCVDELMTEQLHAMGSDPDLAALADEEDERMKKEPRSNAETAATMHETNCMGEPGYAAAVVRCWNIDDCHAFAACVRRTR